ncbi:MAG TPA: TlpA disulfide reductase family protein, partial [Terriglobales bacterium]|nr:TlpA disulfide reductase family protein [Terriglobales bacterium]
NSAIDPMRVENIDATVTINYWIGSYTFHIYTRITVGTATVQLTNTPNPAGVPGRGQIVLTIPVTVNFGWEGKPFFVSDPTDFGFTIVQAFTLTLDGTQVGLQTVGAVQINIPGSVPSDESDPARSRATTLFNNLWSSEKSRINQQVNGALSAGGLESFLHSLMNPAGGKGAKVDADLAYTSFEINSSGIVLHGSLSVPPWPSAHIDFDNDPSSPPGTHGYQALNSWIPGGTIQDYLWTFGTHAVNDSNRFVVQDAPLFTFSTCLTLTGQRISAAGLVFYEPVIAGLCKTQSAVSAKLPPGAALPSGMQRPLVALVRPAAAPASGLEVVGHISPWTPKELGAATANVVVHFPDSRSATQLDVLPSALVQSGRTDTAAAILAVLTRDQLSLAKPVDGLMYADEATAWEQLLGVQHRPSTVLLDPSGNTAWRQDGPADLGALAGALRDSLVTGAEIYPKFPSSPLQTGERSPNFEFEFPAGQQLTLRKLAGKPVVLVFFKRASAPSVETIRNLHGLLRQGVGPAVIVAIDDGDDGQFARGLAAGEEGDIIVVPDPDRQISLAYRITVWPTIVFLDAEGLVRDVRFGLLSQKDVQLPVGSKPIPAGAVGKET